MQPGTNRQVPDHAILDHYNKQLYLGNRFCYAVSAAELTNTSEVAFMLLTNPMVTTVAFPAVGYQSLFVDWKKLICLTVGQGAVLRFYLNPTFSVAGSVKAPLNLRPASNTTSIASLSTGPTVSANGNLIWSLSSNPLSADSSDKSCILDPGQSMLITAQASSTTTFIDFSMEWNQL